MSTRPKCPTGKRRHHDKTGAIIHMKKLQEPGMNAYRCKQCQGWHIGHASRMEGIQSRLNRLIGPDPKTLKRAGVPALPSES